MNENEEVEFIINCKMKRSWMNTFCSFLKMMENLGHDGMSRDLIFYCDGDGDFRPQFNLPEYRTKQAKQYKSIINGERSDAYFFDVENKYIEDMKQKEKERKEYFQDMKNLLDKNKEE